MTRLSKGRFSATRRDATRRSSQTGRVGSLQSVQLASIFRLSRLRPFEWGRTAVHLTAIRSTEPDFSGVGWGRSKLLFTDLQYVRSLNQMNALCVVNVHFACEGQFIANRLDSIGADRVARHTMLND